MKIRIITNDSIGEYTRVFIDMDDCAHWSLYGETVAGNIYCLECFSSESEAREFIKNLADGIRYAD